MADDVSVYRLALKDMLQDRAGASWTEEELDSALSLALADVSQRVPLSLSGDVTLDGGGREVPLGSLAGLLWVEEVWWPYEGGSYPPNLVPFEARDGVVHLLTVVEPAPGDMVHVLYAGEPGGGSTGCGGPGAGNGTGRAQRRGWGGGV